MTIKMNCILLLDKQTDGFSAQAPPERLHMGDTRMMGAENRMEFSSNIPQPRQGAPLEPRPHPSLKPKAPWRARHRNGWEKVAAFPFIRKKQDSLSYNVQY